MSSSLHTTNNTTHDQHRRRSRDCISHSLRAASLLLLDVIHDRFIYPEHSLPLIFFLLPPPPPGIHGLCNFRILLILPICSQYYHITILPYYERDSGNRALMDWAGEPRLRWPQASKSIDRSGNRSINRSAKPIQVNQSKSINPITPSPLPCYSRRSLIRTDKKKHRQVFVLTPSLSIPFLGGAVAISRLIAPIKRERTITNDEADKQRKLRYFFPSNARAFCGGGGTASRGR